MILQGVREISWKEWNERGNFEVTGIAEEENENCQ